MPSQTPVSSASSSRSPAPRSPSRLRLAIRIAPPAVLSLTIAIAAWAAFAPGQHAVPRSACPQQFGPAGSYVVCYPADQVTQAERQMPVNVVPPMGYVPEKAQLALTSEQVTRRHVPPGQSADEVLGIRYIFGAGDTGDCVTPSKNKWIEIGEFVGHARSSVGDYRMYGCAARIDFMANMPDRNLTLVMSSNLPPATVNTIGLEILGSGLDLHLGKPLGSAHRTRAAVLALAKAQAGRLIRPGSYTVQYGSLKRDGHLIDVWAIKLTRLSPPLYAGLMLLSDATGTVLDIWKY